MKENPYDSAPFFEKYSDFPRSKQGLCAAGEWPAFRAMLPDFAGKRVLDLGCGFGWHCRYAAEQGAARVVGCDISEKMLDAARRMTAATRVDYHRVAIEDAVFADGSFDAVISSLAFHYIEDFDGVCQKVSRWLAPGGDFVFSCEHPVFTAKGRQDWLYGAGGEKLCWPVDAYFQEGWRRAVFLGEEIAKYHRTVTGYVGGLLRAGFALTGLVEPMPPPEMDMPDELRRPMMLILRARKA